MMKKLLFILAVVIITGCSPVHKIVSTVANFENYNSNGFLVTTSSVAVPYKSLGLVSVECQPGYYAVKKEDSTLDKDDDYYQTHATPANYASCNKGDLVGAMHKEAALLGANGIIDIKFGEYVINTRGGYIVVYSATGLAVDIQK